MSRVLKIEISETVEELKSLLNLTKNQKVKERIQTLYWLKSEQVKSENESALPNRKTQNNDIEMVEKLYS
jgi:hypothetical protein